MIPATEALQLESAQLSPEEIVKADAVEAAIEEYVRKHMERRGCDIQVKETNFNVIAEVNQRLVAAGYTPQWQMLMQKHNLNAAMNQHTGYALSLIPTVEAYKEAARRLLS